MSESSFLVAGPEGLSSRELEVMVLISNGLSNEEVAAALYLGLNTVKTYIRTAYRKIGVLSRAQAIVWGARHGLMDGVSPDRPTLAVQSCSAA